MKSKAAAPSERVSEDFEPICNWKNEEGCAVIELHVQGFKKEHLRVQASNAGAVTVTGERPLDDRRRSRFRKEFKLPKEYKLNETRARLRRGVLSIILPKATDVTQEKPQKGGWQGIDRKMALLVLAMVAALVGAGVAGFLIWRYLIL